MGTIIDWDLINKYLKQTEDKLGPVENNMFGNMDGFTFSIIMQTLLVSKGECIMDTGNWENANYACIYELIAKIKKHPILWYLFFMIA